MRGFTLVELLVALVIGSIIVIGLSSAYTSQQRINQSQDQIVEMQQNLRAGLDMMIRELRMAGYDPDGTGAAGFTAATANSVTFTMIDDEVGGVRRIRYEFSTGYGDTDGIRDIRRTVNSGKTIVLVENVENVEFLYILENEEARLSPTFQELSDIRSVKISVLVRSSGISLNYTDTASYFPASSFDALLSTLLTPWNPGPFGDNVRRRMQIITVDCRNML